MITYIDIDRGRMTVNGQAVTEREMLTLANKLYSFPARFFCLLRNDRKGQYRYADFQSAGTGDTAGHPGE